MTFALRFPTRCFLVSILLLFSLSCGVSNQAEEENTDPAANLQKQIDAIDAEIYRLENVRNFKIERSQTAHDKRIAVFNQAIEGASNSELGQSILEKNTAKLEAAEESHASNMEAIENEFQEAVSKLWQDREALEAQLGELE